MGKSQLVWPTKLGWMRLDRISKVQSKGRTQDWALGHFDVKGQEIEELANKNRRGLTCEVLKSRKIWVMPCKANRSLSRRRIWLNNGVKLAKLIIWGIWWHCGVWETTKHMENLTHGLCFFNSQWAKDEFYIFKGLQQRKPCNNTVWLTGPKICATWLYKKIDHPVDCRGVKTLIIFGFKMKWEENIWK